MARYQRESEASLRWVEQAKALARRAGFRVPPLRRLASGALSAGGWTLEPWLPGGAPTNWQLFKPVITRFHNLSRRLPARPGHPAMYRRGGRFARFFPKPTLSAVHGDLHAGNVLVGPGGPALIDWEESRRDDPAFDLAAFRPKSAEVLHLAYEGAVCWQREPARARQMAARLRLLTARPLC
ncbi:MAG: phosphotransferase [Pseudomonadota bacterium]